MLIVLRSTLLAQFTLSIHYSMCSGNILQIVEELPISLGKKNRQTET